MKKSFINMLLVSFIEVSQKSRKGLQSKNEAMFTSPSNVIKSPPSIPRNPSLQKLNNSRAGAEEIRGVHTDSNVMLSPSTTTGQGSAKGTPIVTDHGKSPQAVASDLTLSPLTRGLIKHHPTHQTRRQMFNIITGHPLQQESDPTPVLESNSPSFTSSLNKINSSDDQNSSKASATGINAEASTTTTNTEQLEKAPHLDMRRNRFQKNSSFSGLSTYRASFKPTPGFYSSTIGTAAVPSTTKPWASTSTMMNYSRHSVSHNLKMSKGAPLSSGFAVSMGSDSSLLG